METGVKNRAKGFSLAEAMMAMVILGIAASSMILPYITGASVRAEGMRGTLATKLVNGLMEKIINTSYSQVVSSHNYTENKGQLRNVDGSLITDPMYQNFSRQVTSQYTYVPQESRLGSVKYIVVTVKVFYNGQEKAVARRLITVK